MLGEGVLAPPWGGVGNAKQTFHSRIIPHKVLAPPWGGKGHAPMIGPNPLPQGGASTLSPHPPQPPPLLSPMPHPQTSFPWLAISVGAALDSHPRATTSLQAGWLPGGCSMDHKQALSKPAGAL